MFRDVGTSCTRPHIPHGFFCYSEFKIIAQSVLHVHSSMADSLHKTFGIKEKDTPGVYSKNNNLKMVEIIYIL